MWICLNDAFLSVVVSNEPGKLMVRARRKEHLRGLFPETKILKTVNRDYRYRVVVSRAEVAGVMCAKLAGLDYPNFKDSVKDEALHDMYSMWWGDHVKLTK